MSDEFTEEFRAAIASIASDYGGGRLSDGSLWFPTEELAMRAKKEIEDTAADLNIEVVCDGHPLEFHSSAGEA